MVKKLVSKVLKPDGPFKADMKALINPISIQALTKIDIRRPTLAHPKKEGTRARKKVVNKHSGMYPTNTIGITNTDEGALWLIGRRPQSTLVVCPVNN